MTAPGAACSHPSIRILTPAKKGKESLYVCRLCGKVLTFEEFFELQFKGGSK